MKNKGFSFVELLVAVAILGIISLPIASSFALSAKIDAKARETYSASNAADDVLLLVTEFDQFEKLDACLEFYEAKEVLTADKRETPEGEKAVGEENADDSAPITVYEIVYNGYQIELTATAINQTLCRIDIALTYSVAGETMQITRKGVLPIVE